MNRFLLSFTVLVGWLLLADIASADEPRSPLHCIPDVADLVVVAPSPAALLDALTEPALFQQAQKLAPVRELLEGTNFRRFLQLVRHFEREMGQPARELLDQAAGGGIALATRLGSQPAPALVVIQGRDAKASARFYSLVLQLIEQELERQGAAGGLVKGSYQGIDGVAIGNNAFLAQTGTTILFANKKEALAAAIDLAQGTKDAPLASKPAIQEIRKVLPEKPLTWMWLNMERVRETSPEAEALYKTPREPLATMIFGGYFDLLGRTPSLGMALVREKDDFALHIRTPVGREGMGPDRLLHVGPDGRAASRPLLEPKGVLFSTSFHLDLAAFWNDRTKIFGADVVSGLEQADKGLTQFPLNRIQLSRMLKSTAPYHRVVAAVQTESGYQRRPRTPVPAFAIVTETVNDDFAAGMETIARGAGLALSTQIRLKLKEEKVGDVTLIGYRVDEERPFPDDPEDFRFAVSPCFARVGNQVLLCSTIELARDLIPLIQAEKAGDRMASVETRFYGAGFAELLALQKDQLITQAILDQAVPAGEAREQVAKFLALLRSTGGASLKATYAPQHFDYEIRIRLSQGK